ncbi:MAG: hypothetical protein A2622_02605 [Bdellovibrionales bacterium RIFCSPHIGHO2_01_FULL_40_29]|nr:MAG: hypothetical protein A2622_02605 [Bdellovibrionales bacterium RIFCSPHIGHO2_01_FULL_40_29]OFZ33972.1 MAG: hypothetical protein A3D17_03025 [Bdellovibrionales bacterium RIFCSPHIGHO2_02_FULL_40_15]
MKLPKRVNFIYILVVAVLAFVFLWEQQKLSSTLDFLESDDSTFVQKVTSTAASQGNSAPEIHSGKTNTQTPPPTATAEFKKWFSAEAEKIDRTNENFMDRERELRQHAAHFTTSQIDHLKSTALSETASGNERIMASYFLTIGGLNSLAALIDVAQAPYSITNPQPAHSLGETTLMQEKAIRMMAIDELFAKYEIDAITKKQLTEALIKIPDQALKQHALKRLEELQ